jgi:hypothetical protein
MKMSLIRICGLVLCAYILSGFMGCCKKKDNPCCSGDSCPVTRTEVDSSEEIMPSNLEEQGSNNTMIDDAGNIIEEEK